MQPYPTWLEIDLDAVEHNTRAVLSLTHSALMAVVKANAYGFGAAQIAAAALRAGAQQLAVARFGEAEGLRQAGIQAPALVFGMVTPVEVERAIAQNVTLSLYSRESAALVAAHASAAQQPVHVHLKVETGFGRLGILPEELPVVLDLIRQNGWIQIDGVYSHLAMADEIPDHPVTHAQIGQFETALGILAARDVHPRWIHLANSAGTFGLPLTHYSLVRVGTALVGMKPFYFEPFPASLRRVLQWKAQLASCKILPAQSGVGYGHAYHTQSDEWIGVLPVGYGDGFRRLPGNEVLIGGQRVPVVGRVCNDMCMLRLPHAFPEGSEVILIGSQQNETISTDELVDRWHTSQADITSGISLRVPRVYSTSSSAS